MTYDSIISPDKGLYTIMHVVRHDLSFLPLLELHHDYVVMILRIGATDDEIHSFLRQRYVVFDCNYHFIVDLFVIYDITHELQ